MVRPSLGRFVPSAALLAPAALAAACTTTTSTGIPVPAPTSVSVDPSYFLDDVPCTGQPGGLQSYVATLVDVTDPEQPFVLASSTPVACSLPSEFRYVVPGHAYMATIDGYDVAAAALAPCGGPASGARRMVRAGSTDCQHGAVVPRWTSSCGQTAGTAAVAGTNMDVPVGSCDPLVDHGSSPTAIDVDPTAALGSLACAGTAGGTLSAFDVLPLSAALPPVLGLVCGAPPVRFASGLEGGGSYAFRIVGHVEGAAKGQPSSLGSSCHATVVPGLTVAATCEPLAATGALRVAVASLLASAKVACVEGSPALFVTSLEVGGAPVPIAAAPSRCDADEVFGPLEQGACTLKLAARDAAGAQLLAATCTAAVEAGQTTTAACSPTP
jgi:hypothetical protein